MIGPALKSGVKQNLIWVCHDTHLLLMQDLNAGTFAISHCWIMYCLSAPPHAISFPSLSVFNQCYWDTWPKQEEAGSGKKLHVCVRQKKGGKTEMVYWEPCHTNSWQTHLKRKVSIHWVLTLATGSCPWSCAPPPALQTDPRWRRTCPGRAVGIWAYACASWTPPRGLTPPPHQRRSSSATREKKMK